MPAGGKRSTNVFLNVMSWRSRNRQSALRLPGIRRLRNKLIQRSVGLLVNESEDALGMVLQDRTTTPARLRYTHAMIAPTLQTFDRSAGTDLKAFGRLTSRRSRLHRFDNSLTQVTGQRFRHRRSPPGESMPIDSLSQTA